MGLPEDLREVLEVLRDGILGGHLALSRALKKRYEEQYPLVRSLADVFTQHVSRSRSSSPQLVSKKRRFLIVADQRG